jgi:glycosyltransferase involved in cell wall biosynthesis
MNRIALISDFLEDGWYSMDLVAEMLLTHLQAQPENGYKATLIRPPMKRRMGVLPVLGSRSLSRKADQACNRFFDYPRLLRPLRKEFDVFHVVDHSYGQLVHDLPPERTVLTCHDVDAFRCITEPQAEPRSRMFRAMSRRILSGLQRAAKVACSSAFTRDEILRFGLLPRDRLSVIPLAVAPVFSPEPDPVGDSAANRLLGAPDRRTVEILHVGSTVPRKRIDILLRVFAEVRRKAPNVRLIRSGGNFTLDQTKMLEKLGLRDSVTELPFLERRHLASIYRRANVVLQPSEREGFGLPVIEALASGTPLVASDLPVLRETGGTAATYCHVEDVPAWRDAVLNILGRVPGDTESVGARTRGFVQAGKFTWSAYASSNADLYRELLTQ